MVRQNRTAAASALVAAAMLGSIATYLVMGTAAQSQRRVELRPVNLLPEGNRLPYSDAIFAGNLLYISSRIGSDPATGRLPENPEQEARAVLNSIKSVVEKAGLIWTILCTCRSLPAARHVLRDVQRRIQGVFQQICPGRAFTGPGPLVGGARFHVQAVAMKR